jgi:UDP-4-amino-4,6-dideoxy-N-acetyl-beta-L-altrosamine transaminase
MLSQFPYSRQKIDKADIDSVARVLKSDFLTQGPKSAEFEKKLSAFTGAKYVSAVNSATSGLYLACRALGLKKNDYAWTTPNTFVSSANCIINCGAKVDFVDIDKDSFNIDIDLLEQKLKKTPKKKIPKIVIPIHLAGCPYDQKKLFYLSKKYKFKIIEDASHAIGAKNDNYKVGNCKWSDFVIYSFHPVKIITTGEGGAVLTNNKDLSEKVNILRTHGITRNPQFMQKNNRSYWYYEQIDIGYNFRISDIHAALGISQLKKINTFIKNRNFIARCYKKILKDLPIKLQKINNKCISSYHLFIIKMTNTNNIKNYDKIFNYLRKKRIFVNLHYLPVHKQPFYKKLKYLKNKKFKISEQYSKSALSLPVYPGLNEKNIMFIYKNLKFALNKFK